MGFAEYRRWGRVRAGYELSMSALPLPRLICRIDESGGLEELPGFRAEAPVLDLALLVQDAMNDPLFACSIEIKLSERWRNRLARVLPVEQI